MEGVLEVRQWLAGALGWAGLRQGGLRGTRKIRLKMREKRGSK